MQIPEVAAYKSEVRIVYDVPFGIFVLVETKQSSTVSQAGEYLAGMAAAAECHVYIRSVRTDIHSVNAWHQQYRNMICRFFFHLSFITIVLLLYALIACLCFFLSQVFLSQNILQRFAEFFRVHKGLFSLFFRPDFDGVVHADKAYLTLYASHL